MASGPRIYILGLNDSLAQPVFLICYRLPNTAIMTGSEYSVLSKRGNANVEAIMPKIKGQVAERVKENNTNIDLSTAENWFIRSELIDICKEIITQELRPEAC